MTTGRSTDAGPFDDASMEDMESLLQQEEAEYRSLRRGDVIEGIVMDIGREGVLVDIGSKSEGIIPQSEMHSLGADPMTKVRRGEELLVYVLQPESQEGQVLLSLDRARGEQGWRTLQKRFEDGDSFEGEVSGYNKGGLLVNVEGVNAFVPLSQVVGVRPDREEGGEGSLASAVGRALRLKVIEINRRRNRVILSERAAMQEYRSVQKDRLLSELHEGEIRRGRITSVRPFGVFIDLGGADGLAHLSELTWERGKSPEEVYKVGDEVDAFVMKVDPDTKKIALSLRRAQPERWDEIVDQYRVHQIVPGRVTKLVTFGAFARIDGPVEGLVHVSELSDRRIQTPSEIVRVGDIIPLKVVRIERDKHRIGLSLRQARDDAERQGWEFDNNGGVISFPEFMRGEVEAKLGVSPPQREGRPEPRPDDRGESRGEDQRQERSAPPAQPQQPPPQQRESRTRQTEPSAGAEARQAQQQREREEEASAPSGFEALRGFVSEADKRAEAEARSPRNTARNAARAPRPEATAEPDAANAEAVSDPSARTMATVSAPDAESVPAELVAEALPPEVTDEAAAAESIAHTGRMEPASGDTSVVAHAQAEPEGVVTGPEAVEDAATEGTGRAQPAARVVTGMESVEDAAPAATAPSEPAPPDGDQPRAVPRGEERTEQRL